MSRTYRKGQQIEKLIDCIAYIYANAYFFCHDRLVTSDTIRTWSVNRINGTIRDSRMFLAERKTC